jgi:hypothetical protein
VRRLLIQYILPFLLCLVPFLAGFLVAVSTPHQARTYYLTYIQTSYLDWLILGTGSLLFLIQIGLTWQALRWRGGGFDEGPDRWVSNLAQAAEWFPILGLLSTVAGILQTFSRVAADPLSSSQDIIASYAPAITGTGSGLFMAFLNLLPSWIIMLGRDVILTLGGGRRRRTATPEKQP